MLKKVLLSLALFIFALFLVPAAHAQGEFSTTTNITYDVAVNGDTEVTEDIDIKNLTERYYASSFSLTIGVPNITNVSATDSSGPLGIKTTKDSGKSKIEVDFKDQNAGLGKEYRWTLKFHTSDFAQKQGKVWQIIVPKIIPSSDSENYKLTLSVPDTFGKPTSISPKPSQSTDSPGKLNFLFSQDQVKDSGIIANFGSTQYFDFKLTYKLFNDGLFPAIEEIVLPPDTNYQNIIYRSIDPQPENVYIDDDGNYIAQFKVGRKKTLDITIDGVVKLNIDPSKNTDLLSAADIQKWTSSQKYWEKDNPTIKAKADEILKSKNNLSNKEKAKLINDFVSNYLKYDNKRLDQNDYTRYGAVTALANPDKSLCSEFSDLFIALARAVNLPARGITGYAYTSNQDLRPLSFQKNVLHAWPEYYDQNLGWVMIDPTWQSTTGGIDYFDKSDLNHLTFYVESDPQKILKLADNVEVKFSDENYKINDNLSLNMETPSEIFAGFPTQLKVRIENLGNRTYPSSEFNLSSGKLGIFGNKTFNMPSIPPFGSVEYTFDMRSSSIFENFSDNLVLKIGDKTVNKSIKIQPFFAFRFLSAGTIIIILGMIGAYVATLVWHIKHPKVIKRIIFDKEE